MPATRIQKEYLDDELPSVSSGTTAPSSTPTKVGDIYIDTVADNSYLAVGTASSADWKLNGGGGAAFNGCRAYKTTTQSITSTLTAVTFDVENYDTNTYHDNTTNNTRFTVPSDGYYHVTAVAPTSNNTAYRAQLRVDGSTVIAATAGGNAGASTDNGPNISTDYYLTSGQYVELLVAYLSTTSNAASGVGGTVLAIHRVG